MLVDACRNFSEYPCTLLKAAVSQADLDDYCGNSLRNEAALFDSSKQRIVLWEAWAGAQHSIETKVGNVKQLTEHIVGKRRIQTVVMCKFKSTSQTALPGIGQFDSSVQLLSRDLQNPPHLPSYVNVNQTRDGRRKLTDEPLEAGLAHFRSDDKLSLQERWPAVGRLGRSGEEIRHSFLLRSVKRARGATDPWPIRQVAVYHSFDVDEGLSLAWRTRRHLLPCSTTPDVARDPQPTSTSSKKVPEEILALNMLDYKELRKLSILSERFEKAALVIHMNVGALGDAHDYYQRLSRCPHLKPDIQAHMEKSISDFLLKVEQIIRSLETRHTQLVSLRSQLENGKRFWPPAAAELRISRIIADVSLGGMARRTEREIVLMHTPAYRRPLPSRYISWSGDLQDDDGLGILPLPGNEHPSQGEGKGDNHRGPGGDSSYGPASGGCSRRESE
ncbi:hypothetical protein N657DRAFT_633073 [Parathielavia appendiculata]|uniref:CorA-like transporter domain-containing protein n=1 Tax=Parathielavia appendiculata TaxID=2587402 RepID=A0AAN6Z5Q8_9PEZI|nr:hypothetical protein N657DRAFT_633073 [Parathielavia appendiculata]